VRNRGLTLVETLIALFICFVGLLLVVNLFHNAARLSRRTERQRVVLMLTERAINEVRAWARIPANFAGPWTAWNPRTLAYPEHPDVQVQVRCLPPGDVVFSPTELLESRFRPPLSPTDLSRQLPATMALVEARGAWAGTSNVTLTACIAEPPRAPNLALSITPPLPAGVAPNGLQEFQVQAFDDTGTPLQGLTYTWYLEPLTGNGTLVASGKPRDGSRIQLQHSYAVLGSAAPVPVPGMVKLRCRARYGAATLEGTVDVTLL
jgi:type II secretory pathway pseudopilin PulG